MMKFYNCLFALVGLVIQLPAQSKNYFKYIDTVNVRTERTAWGPVQHLKIGPKSFGEINPKPYHLVFNFRYDYIKNQFPIFMQSIDVAGYLDSVLIDHEIDVNGPVKKLYLGIDVPFALQSAIIKALLDKIGIVDEVVLLKKGDFSNETREIVIGGGNCPYSSQQLYLRSFSNIRQLAQAQNKEEFFHIFEQLNEGYSKH